MIVCYKNEEKQVSVIEKSAINQYFHHDKLMWFYDMIPLHSGSPSQPEPGRILQLCSKEWATSRSCSSSFSPLSLRQSQEPQQASHQGNEDVSLPCWWCWAGPLLVGWKVMAITLNPVVMLYNLSLLFWIILVYITAPACMLESLMKTNQSWSCFENSWS